MIRLAGIFQHDYVSKYQSCLNQTIKTKNSGIKQVTKAGDKLPVFFC